MKLITSLTAMVAAASAGHIFNQPQAEHYANVADNYQLAVEYQQHGIQDGQSNFAHDLAYQRQSADKNAKILAYQSDHNGHSYHYAYETENGIKAQEAGHVSKGTRAEGAYSYTGDDGHVYTVTYTADEHGFRPQGAHLPTSPPIPEAILKSLEENAKNEANGIFDDGHYQEQHQAENYQAEPILYQEHQSQGYDNQQSYSYKNQQAQGFNNHAAAASGYDNQQSYNYKNQQAQSFNNHAAAASGYDNQQPYNYKNQQAQSFNNHAAAASGYHH